jgi:hypothetical protein
MNVLRYFDVFASFSASLRIPVEGLQDLPCAFTEISAMQRNRLKTHISRAVAVTCLAIVALIISRQLLY